MAKTTTPAPAKAVVKPFKAFQWQYGKYEHDHSLQTAALDIGKGIATILEIIEIGLAAHEHQEKPMFNDNYRARLKNGDNVRVVTGRESFGPNRS
ncbi:hypothetical protein [Glaciimonas immobilis]|uniref:Uncharacterized protein n=1 Tax=Glaciimonas immobilis TaxID=728004 RepID=A0A840RNS1_9BURK|nr:hypothetical protein [Glaciimonas immobilis]KAF3998899.1 hypothetical protein HAV38_02755 [Glaciimonas immobilis]MBB5198300.1 hypothetical protein [Glaciimonas immobilis]